MINLRKITPLNNEFMEKIGFAWHTDNDNSSYIADEIVQVSEKEADAYYEAANELKNEEGVLMCEVDADEIAAARGLWKFRKNLVGRGLL